MKELNYKIGDKFNRLTILGFTEPRSYGTQNLRRFAICKCECGNITEVVPSKLKTGHTRSCGCLHKEIFSGNVTTHGLSDHPLYYVWRSMISRCHNEKDDNYKNYGKRGIKVCPSWRENFEVFYTWAIDKDWKKGYHIDRKDRNGNYSPKNCKPIPARKNREKVKSDLRTALQLLNRIEYLENILKENNIEFKK